MEPITASVGTWTARIDMHRLTINKGGGRGTERKRGTRRRVRVSTIDGFAFDVQTLVKGWVWLARCWVRPLMKVGDHDFDAAFAVKTNDVVKMQALFSNPRIRDLIGRTVNTEHGRSRG